MLAGDPRAGYIYFNLPSSSPARHGDLLPADLDGLTPPPAGVPNVFSGFAATEYGDPQDAIRLFDFHTDFAFPENSEFLERPKARSLWQVLIRPARTAARTLPNVRPELRSIRTVTGLCIAAAYRNFGGHESLILNQTVRLTPITDPYRAGVRVYKLTRTGGVFSVIEQATLGDNTSSRWIGSAAEDHQENIAVGYNFVNDLKAPSVIYTGKLSTDPAGTFRSEATLAEGTGVQKAFGFRWGDYSGMAVDPTDDCTFWMAGEYFSSDSEAFSDFTWLTRIGRFKFEECTPAPRGYLNVITVNDFTNEPVSNVLIKIFPDGDIGLAPYTRQTGSGGITSRIMLPTGLLELKAEASGFEPNGKKFFLSPNGANAVVTIRLRPVPVLQAARLDLTAESCSRNQAAEPGETISANLTLLNAGKQMTRGLRNACEYSGDFDIEYTGDIWIVSPGTHRDAGVHVCGFIRGNMRRCRKSRF